MKKDTPIPESVSRCLWSYDISKLDLKRDSVRIITNVLNYGSQDATDWVRSLYTKEEIKTIIATPRPGEWNKKSLNYWALMFEVNPKAVSRF